jgi:hypothetical protein
MAPRSIECRIHQSLVIVQLQGRLLTSGPWFEMSDRSLLDRLQQRFSVLPKCLIADSCLNTTNATSTSSHERLFERRPLSYEYIMRGHKTRQQISVDNLSASLLSGNPAVDPIVEDLEIENTILFGYGLLVGN